MIFSPYFHMILGYILVGKSDTFYSENRPSLLVCWERYDFDCKKHAFSDENRTQNHMENVSKILQILILCWKCIFGAGEHMECMGTFLGSYRLEKSPNFALYFSHSITIGISIQMIICCICFISVHFDPPGELARRESSRQGKL